MDATKYIISLASWSIITVPCGKFSWHMAQVMFCYDIRATPPSFLIYCDKILVKVVILKDSFYYLQSYTLAKKMKIGVHTQGSGQARLSFCENVHYALLVWHGSSIKL